MRPAAHGQLLPHLERLIEVATRERLAELLERIPEDFSEALVLHDLEGFKYREIAEITGTELGTVMSRIHRGRQMLLARAPSRLRNAIPMRLAGEPGSTADGPIVVPRHRRTDRSSLRSHRICRSSLGTGSALFGVVATQDSAGNLMVYFVDANTRSLDLLAK